jgi:YHS domain-containing protein
MQESKARNAVNTLAGNGLAIHGHDPVAYFVDGEPRKGRPDLTLEYKGAVWRFANEANRRLFESDPGRYAPVFGGYCAYGVSRGYLVKIDPAAWSIVHGRLYLNYDLDVRATWLAEADEYIRRATATWPQLVDEN